MPLAADFLSVRRLALALLIVGAGYAWWVVDQYERLNTNAQVELADAGAELKRALENAAVTLTRFDPGNAPGAACVFDGDQPYIDFVGDCQLETRRYTNVRLSAEGGLRVLADREGDGAAGDDAAAIWRFRADTLMNELALSDAVELVFLAGKDGTVVFQVTPAQRWRRLLRWGEQTFRDSGAANVGGRRILNLSDVLGKDADPDWTRLQAVSDRTTVRLGGEWHQLYTQPVAGGDMGIVLVLGGLTPTQRIVRQALAIDTYFTAVLVVVLLFCAFGLEFVKLAAMGEHERFRTRDVYWLYVNCAALVTIAAFVVLGIDTYARWTAVADRGLQAFADDLETRIVGEVRDIHQALVDYDGQVASFSPSPQCGRSGVLLNWFAQPSRPDADGRTVARRPEVLIDQVAWIDPAGQQIWKATSDRIGRNRSVAQRPYFVAVRDGHLYQGPQSATPFFIAPDRSVTDGKFYTFVSIPSMLSRTRCDTPTTPASGERAERARSGYVVAASATLLSVEQPSLPSGYGFAVVTREGRVLYHSDPRLALRESLFEHLGDSDAAHAIAFSARKQALTTTYRQVPHRVRFNPLPWTLVESAVADPADTGEPPLSGLTLVVFRDLSIERAVIARGFVESLVGPMGWLLGGIVLGLLVAAFISRRRQGNAARWLWPHGGLDPMYRAMAFAFAGIIVAFAVVTWATRQSWPYLLLPLATATAGLIVYSRPYWHTCHRHTLRDAFWYKTEFTLLALGVVVVPAIALFNLTIGHELGSLVRTEQQAMRNRIADADLSLRASARAKDCPAVVGQDTVQAYRSRVGPRPAPFDVAPTALGIWDQRLVHAYRALDTVLPAGSSLTTQLRYQDADQHYAPPGPVGGLSWFGAAGLAAIVGLFVLWVTWSATHLHFADVTPGAPPVDFSLENWNALTDTERRVLLQITEEGIANPRQRPVVLELARLGLIALSPEITASTPAVAATIEQARNDGETRTQLIAWERTHAGHNWGQIRGVLIPSLAVVALFLVVTQPGLQSDLAGIVSGVTAFGASALKLRETMSGWIMSRKPKSARAS